MLSTTTDRLRCPSCEGKLELHSKDKLQGATEVTAGELKCAGCRAKFPILAGVAIVVADVRDYLLSHVKGIAELVADAEIPTEYRREFSQAKRELRESEAEHIEEDLEAERVNALYFMNHYLRVKPATDAKASAPEWWKPVQGAASPVIESLVRDHWDSGPFAKIGEWVRERSHGSEVGDVVELGCGVGGLQAVLRPFLRSYLGVDSSFASIALARHLTLGAPYRGKIRIPEDLINGPVSRSVKLLAGAQPDGRADFVVGELQNSPLAGNAFDLAIALNTIDMLDEPAGLPELQATLLRKGGAAIQSCPYIWHPGVAERLKHATGKSDSAQAVESLYQRAGFKIEKKIDHLPWLFFKHVRQMEVYSVHLFLAGRV